MACAVSCGPAPAFAGPVVSEVVDLPSRQDSLIGSAKVYPFVDEQGILLWDRPFTGDDLQPFQVYDWVNGALVGPYPLLGGNDAEPVLWADREGDRVVVSRSQPLGGVEFYTWSEADQAFAFDTFVEMPDDGNAPYVVQLSGEHMLTYTQQLVSMWHEEPAGWTWLETFDAWLSVGFPYTFLQGDELRYATYYEVPSGTASAMVRRFDAVSETWTLSSELPLDFEQPSVPGIAYNPLGELFVMEQGCMVQRLLPDGDATVALGRVEALSGRACDFVVAGSTDRWVAATSLQRRLYETDSFISLVDVRSPQPFVWDTLVAPREVYAWGFLDDRHLATYDIELLTSPGNVGRITVWELTGPPVLQWLTTPILDEGASLPVDPSVYVMDPDHDLVDVTLILTTPPLHGTFALDGTPSTGPFDAQAWMDGRITYEHDGSETLADSFVLQACDPDSTCADDLLVDITITPVNDPPLPTPDTLLVDEGGSALVDVLANDTDPDSTLDLLGVSVDAAPAGHAAVQTDGLHYTHDGSEPGPDPLQLDLTICDPEGACAPATVAVTVNPVNDPPMAVDDQATVDEGDTLLVEVLANDVDPDDTLAADGTLTVLSGPVHGSVTVSSGALEVQHDGAEVTSDALVYQICDAAGACDEAALQLTVTPVNDPPSLLDDALVLDEGGRASLHPLANDSDEDGTVDATSLTIVTPPTHGAVDLTADVATYTHDGSESSTDSFTYSACDDVGACAEAIVQVAIHSVEHGPVAVPDAYAVDGDLDVSAADGVLANDRDEDSVLTALLVSEPEHGQLALAADGGFTYQPEDGFTGTDRFRYAASDGTGTAEADVVLAVAGASVTSAGDDVPRDGAASGGGGCGCSAGASPSGVLALGLLALVRRRPR